VKLTFEEANDLHVGLLTDEMRPADKAECWALSRLDPGSVLRYSLEVSEWTTAVSDDTGLVCLFGLYEPAPIGGIAAPWMLGTRRVSDHKIALIKQTRRFLTAAFSRYDRLENIVSDDHMASIVYLEAVGFTLGPVNVTPWGARYRRFWKDRHHV